MICTCNGLKEMHENEIILEVPDTVNLKYNSPNQKRRTTVCIDKCIVDEIKLLWKNGIVTYGCCCGHNDARFNPYVIIKKDHVQKAVNLGFEVKEERNNDYILSI